MFRWTTKTISLKWIFTSKKEEKWNTNEIRNHKARRRANSCECFSQRGADVAVDQSLCLYLFSLHIEKSNWMVCICSIKPYDFFLVCVRTSVFKWAATHYRYSSTAVCVICFNQFHIFKLQTDSGVCFNSISLSIKLNIYFSFNFTFAYISSEFS